MYHKLFNNYKKIISTPTNEKCTPEHTSREVPCIGEKWCKKEEST